MIIEYQDLYYTRLEPSFAIVIVTEELHGAPGAGGWPAWRLVGLPKPQAQKNRRLYGFSPASNPCRTRHRHQIINHPVSSNTASDRPDRAASFSSPPLASGHQRPDHSEQPVPLRRIAVSW